MQWESFVDNVNQKGGSLLGVDDLVKVCIVNISDSIVVDHWFNLDASELMLSIRNKLGINQKKMADLLNTKQSAIAFIEKGRRPISKTIARRLQNVTNINYRIFL